MRSRRGRLIRAAGVRNWSCTALGPVPAGVAVYRHRALRTLAADCDVVVHHGGAGSAMTTLWAGRPQLAITFAAEQAATGSRIAAVGAGAHLLGHRATDAAIASAVTRLCRPGPHRAVARRLGAEMADRPAPAQVAGELAALLDSVAA